MSIRSFNQYIDMYFREHPTDIPEDVFVKMRNHWDIFGKENLLSLTSGELLDCTDNIVILCHPQIANTLDFPHSHDYFELIYLSRGTCTQIIDGISCNMSEGDICMLSPNSQHIIRTDSPDTLLFNIMINRSLFQESFLCLIAENDLISNFFLTALFTASENQKYLYFPRHENSASGNLIQALIREFYGAEFGYRKSMECYLALLFTELIRCHKNRIDQDNYELMGNNPLSGILTYMNLHKCDVTLNSVAEKFHYHPNYLSALIKKYTNKSFSEIIQDAKLQEACFYLKNTDIPIEEIGQLMGYYDRSYFNRVFKKHFKMAPGEYRKNKAGSA